MTQILQRPALPGAVALLQQAQLPTEDLTDAHCENFFFSGAREAPDGLVGLEVFGDVALLRSLVVSGQQRGVGTGTLLLAHAEDYARLLGIRQLFLLTTTAE